MTKQGDDGTALARAAGGGRPWRRVARWVAGGVATFVVVGVAGYVHRNVTGLRKGMDAVARAGFTEKRTSLGGYTVNYAEGPRNGPPLLLIHGQGTRWQDHMLVLPELAADHHVFAVDVPGHGSSGRLAPDMYTNVAVARLIAGFIARSIGEPAIVSGHSSGGVLALWLAAERSELVAGLILEDPPLFSSEMPRVLSTTGGDGLRVAHHYVEEGEPGDYQSYYIEHGSYFALFGPFQNAIQRYALGRAVDTPGEPVKIWFLPPEVTVFFHGLVNYDPAFGAAWVDDIWYEGFDTEAALEAVDVPTTLIHTNFFEDRTGTAYGEDGTLRAAMDSDDVARALDLLGDGTTLVKLRSGHLVHFEKPREYVDAVLELSRRVNGPS